MRFAFEDEQLELAAAVRDLLSREVPAERVREAWESEDGRLRDVWAKLADMGVLGLMVPEAHGGLGFSEEEMVLALTECGRVGLPDPVLSSAMVVAPLLAEVIAQDSAPSGAAPLAGTWLERLPGGATAVPAFPAARTVAFANSADVIVGYADGELHVVDPTSVRLSPERSVDGARKLSRLSWEAHPDTLLAQGEAARAMIRNAWNRAALGTAAQLLGLGETMLDMTVGYVSERKQFGVPVGSFQAVKHHLADVVTKIEFAKPVLYHAASALARNAPDSAVRASHAKLVCAEAGWFSARKGIQVHGAMGYTWEVDLQMFMKRAWVLDAAWGDRAFHKQRLSDALLNDGALLGPGATFNTLS